MILYPLSMENRTSEASPKQGLSRNLSPGNSPTVSFLQSVFLNIFFPCLARVSCCHGSSDEGGMIIVSPQQFVNY